MDTDKYINRDIYKWGRYTQRNIYTEAYILEYRQTYKQDNI